MQSLSKIAKKRTIPTDKAEKKPKTARIEIPNDIMILISHIDERFLSQNRLKKIPKALEFGSNYAFTETLFEVGEIEKITIKNTKKLYFEALRNVDLEELILDKIMSFDFSHVTSIKAFSLHLKNMTLEIEVIDKILKLLTPKSIQLENITLKNFNEYSKFKFLNRFQEIGTIQLLIDNCNITESEFSMMAAGAKNIGYSNDKSVVIYSLNGSCFKGCLIFGRCKLHLDIPFEEIENLTVMGDDPISFLKKFDKLKVLALKNTHLESKLIKECKFNLAIVDFDSVTFEDELGFYEFIEKEKESLRWVVMRNVLLPHDGIDWMKKKLRNCRVTINKNNVFYIS